MVKQGLCASGRTKAAYQGHMDLAALLYNIYPWLDFAWLPLALAFSEPGKRILNCLYILASIGMLRLQVELLQQIGWVRGLPGMLDSDIYTRGLIVYGVFIGLFLLLARLSYGTDKNVHLAAAISFLLLSFCISGAIMVL